MQLAESGHSTLNGVVTVISSDSDKCLDCCVVTKAFKARESWESRKGTDNFRHIMNVI